MKKNKLKYNQLAVLGLGSIGLRHAKNAHSLGAGVIGFDPSAERQAIALEHNIDVVSSREETLERCDSVVICTPSHFHIDDLKKCIEAGKPVLVEKPLTHIIDAGHAALDFADDNKVPVFTALNLRFHPVVALAKTMLDKMDIGKVLWSHFMISSYLPEWRPWQDYRTGYASHSEAGGVILDNVHEIDLALSLLGPASKVSALCCQSGELDIPVEDIAHISLVHETGALSSVHLDFCTKPSQRSFQIAGTQGVIKGNLLTRELIVLSPNGEVLEQHKFDGAFDSDYLVEMTEFLSGASETQDRKLASGWEGLSASVVALKARHFDKKYSDMEAVI